MYNALTFLLDISTPNLDGATDELKLPRLSANERKFLTEYCKVLAPLAQSLDLLQGEKTTFLGKIRSKYF